MTTTTTLAQLLTDARLALGYSQTEVARRAGMSKQRYHALEVGESRSCAADREVSLARVLDLDVATIRAAAATSSHARVDLAALSESERALVLDLAAREAPRPVRPPPAEGVRTAVGTAVRTRRKRGHARARAAALRAEAAAADAAIPRAESA